MTLKLLTRTAPLLGLALLLAACGGDDAGSVDTVDDSTDTDEAEDEAAGNGETYEFVLSVETTPGDTLADLLNFFGDALEDELGDQVVTDRFFGGAMGDEEAQLEALRAGQIDVLVVGSDIVTFDPMFGILELPFLFESREQVTDFLDGELGDEMSESLAASAGMHVLAFGENGFRHITNNNRPIVTPEDMQGLTLRVPGVPARLQAFEALGASPTAMSIDEVYIALDQGVVDGQENPLAVINAFSFYEVQSYLSLSGHVYTPATLVMNLERWESLPPEIQEAALRAGATAAQNSRNAGEQADAELISVFEDAGVQVNEIDIESFQTAVEPVWEDLRDEIGADFVDRVLASLGGS